MKKKAPKDNNSHYIRDSMTTAPVTLPSTSDIFEAARAMRDSNIGDVLVRDDQGLCGIVTDRDIVVRVLAEGETDARLGEICSRDLVTVSPDDDTSHVVELMRKNALRRVVVATDNRAEGIVSLGDLAMKLDQRSALSDISAAPPNN